MHEYRESFDLMANRSRLLSLSNWSTTFWLPVNGTTTAIDQANDSDFLEIHPDSNVDDVDRVEYREPIEPNYWGLLALILVFGTATGNILVCLAIVWERRLQNVTNYFLMSLAITDLMVAILVMPLGILTLVKGKSSYPISFLHTLYNITFNFMLSFYVAPSIPHEQEECFFCCCCFFVT